MLRVPYRILGGGGGGGGVVLTRASMIVMHRIYHKRLGTSLLVNVLSEFDLIKILSALVTPHWNELLQLIIHSVGLFTIICVT